VLSQLPSIRKDVASDAVFIARWSSKVFAHFMRTIGPATI